MNEHSYPKEIRDSDIRELLEKVQKQNYGSYLRSMRLGKIRFFKGAHINFDFPVTALIGPNGGGKSTILGISACIYTSINPSTIFRKSRVGDESMNAWEVEYDVIDKAKNTKGLIRSKVLLNDNQWLREQPFERNVKIFGIVRTVPPIENPFFSHKKILSTHKQNNENQTMSVSEVENIDYIKREAEKILGKSLEGFKLVNVVFTTIKHQTTKRRTVERKILEDGAVLTIKRPIEPIVSTTSSTTNRFIYLGENENAQYSEFNFGAGESSVIHMVAEIESQPTNSLVLIEEIENGLHPLAAQRMVEYLIDVSKRKSLQVIFTTHSDYALNILPPEAIWASIDGKLQQGKLTVETLRAISGRVDKKLAIFVEDNFAKNWIEAVLREKIGENFDEVGIYPLLGDGNAVKAHSNHSLNPAIQFHSLCYIDGDSKETDNNKKGVYRLPGDMPEATVFNSVLTNLNENIALLTVACQRPIDKQDTVSNAIKSVSHTNRDAHLLFSQVGVKLSFTSEEIIRGAFLSVWIQENPEESEKMVIPIKLALTLPPK
jgi:AAA15 family ATPase/GTPase